MARSLDVPEVSQFVAGTVAGVLYGIFLVLAAASGYLLVSSFRFPDRRRTNSGLLLVLIIIATLITANFAMYTDQTATALIDLPPGPAREGFLLGSASPTSVALLATVIVVVIIGDMALVWRCWAVWRDWKVVAPLILFVCASIATGGVGVYRLQHAHPTDIVWLKSLKAWSDAFLACSLVANVCATACIAGRLYYLDRQSRRFFNTGPSISRLAIIIAESGAFNAAFMICYGASLGAKSSVYHIFAIGALYTVGITYCLLIIRLALHGTTASDFQHSISHTGMEFAPPPGSGPTDSSRTAAARFSVLSKPDSRSKRESVILHDMTGTGSAVSEKHDAADIV